MYNKDFIELDLMKYIPLDSYVTLMPESRVKIFTKAVDKLGSQAKLAKTLNAGTMTVSEWVRGARRIHLSKLIELIKICGLDIELNESILDITKYYSAGAISVKGFKILLNEEFAEFLGILIGDGSVNKKNVTCTNTFFDIPLFFSYFLERNFNLKKERVTIPIYFPNNLPESAIILRKKFELLGYKNFYIYRESENKKPLIKVSINSSILARILTNILKERKNLLSKSNNKVKAAYIRGIAASDGTVTSHSVGIISDDIEELYFIKDLLKSLGIKSANPRRATRSFQLHIYGEDNLEKFNEDVGFGLHEIRNQKLLTLLRNYKHKSPTRRFQEISELINMYQKMTAKEVSIKLGLKYKQTLFLLNKMLEKGIINIDDKSKTHVFHK